MIDSWTVVIERCELSKRVQPRHSGFSQSLSIKAHPRAYKPRATDGGTIGAQF